MNRIACFFLGLKEYKKDSFSTTLWTAKGPWTPAELVAYVNGQRLVRWATGTRMVGVPLDKGGRPTFGIPYMHVFVPSDMPMWLVNKVSRDYFLEREAYYDKNFGRGYHQYST